MNKDRIKAFGVKQLSLFGSFAAGNQKSSSDVDLLVEFEQGKKTYDNFIELSFYLEEMLNRRVELITIQSLSRRIAPHILKQAENVPL
ncbi:nucleotidyltransferase family protein [Rubrolithibacter danxiaensis]|uniref:nucleotidyltransferase family protein n=1 Tax=Rubrolithibacter danxiaensis TaxID=3390805 RepID=UPI003BF8C1DE